MNAQDAPVRAILKAGLGIQWRVRTGRLAGAAASVGVPKILSYLSQPGMFNAAPANRGILTEDLRRFPHPAPLTWQAAALIGRDFGRNQCCKSVVSFAACSNSPESRQKAAGLIAWDMLLVRLIGRQVAEPRIAFWASPGRASRDFPCQFQRCASFRVSADLGPQTGREFEPCINLGSGPHADGAIHGKCKAVPSGFFGRACLR